MDLDLLTPRERLELLTAYLDGELGSEAQPVPSNVHGATARDVMAWLDQHPEALREIERQRRLWDLLGRYGDEPVPADFVQRVLAATGAGRERVQPPPATTAPRIRHRWALAAAAAALVAVGVGAVLLQKGSRSEPVEGEPRVLAGIDVDYVQHASVEDLLALSDAEFEALLTEDPDELADSSLGG